MLVMPSGAPSPAQAPAAEPTPAILAYVGTFTGMGSHEDAARLLRGLGIRYPAAYAVDDAILRANSVRAMPRTLFFDVRGRLVTCSNGALTESDHDREKKTHGGHGGAVERGGNAGVVSGPAWHIVEALRTKLLASCLGGRRCVLIR